MRDKLREQGEVNLREMALDLRVEPTLMRQICRRLKGGELLGIVNMTKDKMAATKFLFKSSKIIF